MAAESKPAPKTKPTIDLDSTIAVDGKEMSVKQLLDQAAKLQTLESEKAALLEYRKHTETLLEPEAQSPQVKEEAMRYLLNQKGYSAEEIEEAVAQAMFAETGQQQPQQDPQPDMRELYEKIALMEQEQQKAKLNTLKRELGSNTDRVLDSNKNLVTLIDKLKDIRGDDGMTETLTALRADIQDRTLKQLKLRTATSGQLVNDAWIAEEVDKAAELVYKHYLSVIGDPNKLGRAPETVTGENVWTRKQPVVAPAYKPGDNVGTADTKLQEYGIDVLSRLAAAGDTGGKTKA